MSWPQDLQVRGYLAAVGVVVAVVIADVLLPDTVPINGAYALAAVLAAIVCTPAQTASIGVIAVVLSVLSGVWNNNLGTVNWGVRVGICAVIGVLAVVVARVRERREQQLRQMTVIAEVAQNAILRPMPAEVGSVRLAATYVSATDQSLVGGDLYEVAETPHGLRLIIGDARGRGLDAVVLAATVLGGFRQSAQRHRCLLDVAVDLDVAVRTTGSDEDFVTALLIELQEDGAMTIVNCGHHPPLVIPPHGAPLEVPTGEPQLPLGWGPATEAVARRWPPWCRLLLYTDGLVEGRDESGVFFPLEAYASLIGAGSLDDDLATLVGHLRAHVGHVLADDLALVLAERTGRTLDLPLTTLDE